VLALARAGGVLERGIAEGFGEFLVAEQEGGVVGACGLEQHGGDALLRSVVVDAGFRGGGVGRLLVDAALRRARERGLAEVYLLTTSAPEYFARLGFGFRSRDAAPAAIRESWEFRAGCPASARFMSRRP
jgi:amino-acid N-acetyltransferase